MHCTKMFHFYDNYGDCVRCLKGCFTVNVRVDVDKKK